MKHFFLALLFATAVRPVAAQMNYTFKDTTVPYTHLTGSTAVNGSFIWDDENFTVNLPWTWTFNGTIPLTKVNLALYLPGVVADTNDFSNVNGFGFCESDIADRGLVPQTTSQSPIRYTITGSAPTRVFRAEITKGGFYDEYANYGTMDDSFSVQFVLRETSNIVELHYGPSSITHPADYFAFGTGPLIGLGRNFDFDNGSSGTLYYLSGSPTAPTIDSFTLPSIPTGSLSAWPPSGTVYRFTPKSNGGTGVAAVQGQLPLTVSPNRPDGYLTVDYAGSETATYRIVNTAGALCGSGNIKSGKQQLDVLQLAAGNYLLQVSSTAGSAVFRFVKQ